MISFFEPILGELKEVEILLHQQAADAHPELQAALKHLLASGGKRIRPAIGLLSGKMLGGPHDKMIISAASVELLHTATLVHDDLIDGALLRRGIPTLNAQWSSPATVLTGDFLFARAARLASETNNLPLIKLFADTLAIIVNGELTQLFSSRGLASRENYYKRIYAKTASLIEMTTQAAAMLSPVEQTTVESMRKLGYELGMAFQIIDDLLDFTGEQDTLGKPVGSDLLQGLITLPTLYYIENNPQDADVNVLLSGNYATEPKIMKRLVQSIRNSDSISKALSEAYEYINRASLLLEKMPAVHERDALRALLLYVVDRKL